MKCLISRLALPKSCITIKHFIKRKCLNIIALGFVFCTYVVIRYTFSYEAKHAAVVKEIAMSSVLGKKSDLDKNNFTEQTDFKKDTPNHKTYSVMFYCPFQSRFSVAIDTIQPEKCAFSNCKFRRETLCEKDFYPDDAIVFQGNRMPKRTSIPRLNSDQVFVFFNNEPPVYYNRTDLRQEPYRGMFNWTMTYRTDSDIFCPYGRVVRKHNDPDDNNRDVLLHNEDGQNSIVNGTAAEDNEIFKRKNMSSLWFVSHCGTDSKREKYVKTLAYVSDVDQYGSCNGKTVHKSVVEDMYHKYKYYLSFENSMCNDYMTEKVFNWFDRDIIPVVRNRVKNDKFLPPGTYINVEDFSSATELGLFLNKLASNKEEYMKYLHAKRMFDVVKEQESLHMAFCDLCEKLNNLEANRKSVTDIHTWWADKQCV